MSRPHGSLHPGYTGVEGTPVENSRVSVRFRRRQYVSADNVRRFQGHAGLPGVHNHSEAIATPLASKELLVHCTVWLTYQGLNQLD